LTPIGQLHIVKAAPYYKVSDSSSSPCPSTNVPADLPEVDLESGSDAQRHAAIYLRISKTGGQQTEENQRRELRGFLENEGYRLAEEYVDHESGRRGRKEREASDRMFGAAEDREFDVLVFWSLDRFSREGIRKTISYLQQLEALGVGFRSYTEPYLNTENELVSHILLAVMSYFAEYEAKKISRRTKAGLERAREEGKQIGRPSKFEQHKEDLQDMMSTGHDERRLFESGDEAAHRAGLQHGQEVPPAD
jgi:DNA invertase Pin-like site-specific DNA recombinase